MSIEIPFLRQEKHNTCALACLRMALAAHGTDLEESELENLAKMELGGMEVGQLAQLARRIGLRAEVREATIDQFGSLLDDGKILIAYIDRALFELRPAARAGLSLRNAKIHTVVPTRLSSSSIWYHDPLQVHPVRKSIRLFRLAYERLGSHSIVCWKEAQV